MRDFLGKMGRVLLSIPFFLRWPFVLWNWAAHAHHIPAERLQPVFSLCAGGFSIIALCVFSLLLEPDVRVFMSFFGPYIGAGFSAMYTGILRSREYRHLLEPESFEHRSMPQDPQT